MKRRGFLLTLAGAAVAPAVPAAEPLLRGRLPGREVRGAVYVGGLYVGRVVRVEIRDKDGGMLCWVGTDDVGFSGVWFVPPKFHPDAFVLRYPELAQRVEG